MLGSTAWNAIFEQTDRAHASTRLPAAVFVGLLRSNLNCMGMQMLARVQGFQ